MYEEIDTACTASSRNMLEFKYGIYSLVHSGIITRREVGIGRFDFVVNDGKLDKSLIGDCGQVAASCVLAMIY